LPSGNISSASKHTAITVNELLRKSFARHIPVVGRAALVGEVFTRKIFGALQDLSEKEARILLERALIDPEVAETLILSKTLPQRAITKRINAHLINIGAKERKDIKNNPEQTISQGQ